MQVAEGSLTFNGVELAAGDGASIEQRGTLTLAVTRPTGAIPFDLA